MNYWINIEISKDDGEVAFIDNLEKQLGDIPDPVIKVRQLITRFEACHFKYQAHARHILESIANLHTRIDPSRIGSTHPGSRKDPWSKDKYGRSLAAYRYLVTLQHWLGIEREDEPLNDEEFFTVKRQVKELLGERDELKEKLVKILTQRLQWQDVEKFSAGDKINTLQYQIERTDICHQDFPGNLILVIKGIGKKEPLEGFRGCGHYSDEITEYLSTYFDELCSWLEGNEKSLSFTLGERNNLKAWLVACFAKTIKEQLGIDKKIFKHTGND